jgi:hypothetical protein
MARMSVIAITVEGGAAEIAAACEVVRKELASFGERTGALSVASIESNNTVDSPCTRLLSLWDMVPYRVWQLSGLLLDLRDIEWTVKRDIRQRNEPLPPEVSDKLTEGLAKTYILCETLGMATTLDLIRAFSNALRNSELNIQECGVRLGSINVTIRSELKRRQFAYVPVEKARFLEDKEERWRDILSQFPSIKDDVDSAIDCYVLDCNTACVFHSMRIAERGLRALARALKINTIGPRKHPLEFSEWGGILGALAGRLKELQQSQGRSAKKAAQTKFYADATSQANYLNEIWRKEVSHARGMYNAPEALNALQRTRDFMQLLSGYLSEGSRDRLP